jgi:hypothetical protein
MINGRLLGGDAASDAVALALRMLPVADGSDPAARKLSGWNGEYGCSRCTDDIFDAVVARRAWCNALKKLFDSYDFVILPAA